VAFPIITPYTILTGIKHPAVNIPLDVVIQIVGWLDSGCDLANMALVQRSWCYPAQVELFRAVILKCPLRAQLFVEAFVRNLGPGNPAIRRGVNRLPLERYVRYIYVDVPENYSQVEFYGNLASILPLLDRLCSLYVVLRCWDKYIWNAQLGSYLSEFAPPSLQFLSIQVSGYFNTQILALTVVFRFPLGNLLLDCSGLAKVLFGGESGSEIGRTYGRSPLSAKIHGGGHQPKPPSPQQLKPLKTLYTSG
jgi:hypothetical protein